MINQKVVRIISVFMLLAAVVFECTSYGIMAADVGSLQKTQIYSDMTGGYCVINYDSRKFITTYVRSDGEIINDDSRSAELKTVSFSGGRLVVTSESERTTNIMIYSYPDRKNSTVMIRKTDIMDNLICSTADQSIFLVTVSEPDVVYEYGRNGQITKTHSVGSRINSLFTDSTGQFAIALTDSGAVNINCDSYICGTYPENDFEINGSYCTAGGKVYTFDPENGFELLYNTDYNIVCCSGGEVYAAKDSFVYHLNYNGSADLYYDCGKNVTRLSASGNNIAIISENDITLLNRSSMIKAEESEKIQTMLKFNNTPKIPDLSVSGTDYRIDMPEYKIYGNVISGIKAGTTLAQFRNNINSGDNTVTAVNHHGQAVSSGVLGTGWEISFNGNGKEYVYRVVIKGDVTGEGSVNSRDYTIISDYLLGKEQPDDIHKTAADIDSDGSVTLSDFYSVYGN